MESSQSSPGGEQTAFSFDAAARVAADQVQLRALFAAMVRKAGGADWLAAALNQKPGYATRIMEAINGVEDRKIQLDWFAPMLDDPDAMDLLMAWMSERGHYEPPVRMPREVEAAKVDHAAFEVLAEIKDEEQRDLFKRRMAKKLGVRVEDVPL